MYINRTITTKILQAAKEYPIISIFGPRQSGKTTVAKKIFEQHKYVNLENIDNREFAENDPNGFIGQYRHTTGVILDEVQKVPSLLSYLQSEVDETPCIGKFILTGSQNILLNEKVTQTLSGRTAIFKLLPLSIEELTASKLLPTDLESFIFTGGYPKLYAEHINSLDWYNNYLYTYIERDVRQIKNITDLTTFQHFVKLCAGRIGQVLNISELGKDCGIDPKTAKAWLSVLETSYVIFMLQPYYNNFNKRLIKAPKLYFIDTGVACSLLNIETKEQIYSHFLRGGLFENIIISDLLKYRFNAGRPNNCYYWRDQTGNEIDCIIESNNQLYPIEIKSGKTIYSNSYKYFPTWQQIVTTKGMKPSIVYAGTINQQRTNIDLISWLNINLLQTKIGK
ncbi:MAG: ATP-binding protein [Gammaproteobacteria bacterium]